jgi:hypothetical protein
VAAAAGGSVLVLDAAGVALAVDSSVGWAAKIHCCCSGPEAAHLKCCDSTWSENGTCMCRVCCTCMH